MLVLGPERAPLGGVVVTLRTESESLEVAQASSAQNGWAVLSGPNGRFPLDA